MKSLRIATWAAAAISAWTISEIVVYIHVSSSNHSAFEPWLLVVLFVPTLITGAIATGRRFLVAGLLAMLLGAGGLAVPDVHRPHEHDGAVRPLAIARDAAPASALAPRRRPLTPRPRSNTPTAAGSMVRNSVSTLKSSASTPTPVTIDP